MRIRRLNHSVYQVQYHVVWGTKYRYKILKPYVKRVLIRKIFELITIKYPSWYIHKINTGDDHVHMLLEIPPSVSLAEAVQKLKANTSIYLKHEFKFIRRIYDERGVWGVGYFVSTVELNESQIRGYVEKQDRFDKGEDMSKEFS